MTSVALPDALLLAELDGVQYLQVATPAVFAVTSTTLAYYCTGEAWDDSQAAHEAKRRARIAALEAELATLRGAAPPAPPKLTAARRPRRRALPTPTAPADAPMHAPPASPAEPPVVAPTGVPCPHCARTFPTQHGCDIHVAKKHRQAGEPAGAVAETPAAAEPPPPVAVALDEVSPRQPVIAARPTVVCANCGREGTPSANRADWCKACAAAGDLAHARAQWDAGAWQCGCGRRFARSTQEPAKCIKCTGEFDRAVTRTRPTVAA